MLLPILGLALLAGVAWFFVIAPLTMLLPAVVIATAATIIASQAVISGAYSLTQQSIQLGLLPRMQIIHTSAHERGQIYVPRVNSLLIGGGMLFTFLAAQGHAVGASLLEEDQLDTVRGYLAEAAERGVELVLPTDVVVASGFAADAQHVVRSADSIEDTEWGAAGVGLDIGPETANRFADFIRESSTVFWNGPMGVFEWTPFAAGTTTIAHALTEVHGLSVVGGGDSAAAVRTLGFHDNQFGHISTGGGASLEFLEGKRLPGLEVLGWQ